MGHDKNATKNEPEPDSLENDNILYSDWVTSSGSTIEVKINARTWSDPLIVGFQQAALLIFDDILSEFGNVTASVSLCLCDDVQMRQLNNEHRGIDRPTNVLSFSGYDMAEHKINIPAPLLLGDIVIAAETMLQEADDMQIPVADHLIHLFVHGMLHLFGYDHTDDDLAQTMETLEIKFLANVGIPNPYRDIHMEACN